MFIRKTIISAIVISTLILFPEVSFTKTEPGAAATEQRSQRVRFNELTFSSGYGWGELKGNDNLEIIPFSVRFGFDINALVGVRGPAELQFGVEPFLNTIVAPEEGVEAGFNVGFRYIAPVTDGVSIFGEISSGPAYLSIDTVEQGDGGFNFISQFGAGLQFELTRNVALNAGYRFRHLSNAGFSEPNSGINSDVLLAGISFGY